MWMSNPKNRGMEYPPKMDGENIMENPIFKMDDLGVALFLETPMYFKKI